jgi:hypothetical protein
VRWRRTAQLGSVILGCGPRGKLSSLNECIEISRDQLTGGGPQSFMLGRGLTTSHRQTAACQEASYGASDLDKFFVNRIP